MKEIYEYLKNCGTFYLATVEGDRPQVRPFGAVCEFEGKLYIVTNNQKEVYKQMKANPKVAISGMYKGTWIRVSGEVEEDTRREARVAMMDANKASLSKMYTVDDNLMTVFKFVNGKGTVYSFTENPVEYSL
ncbi:MAG: pyridoxamine 5'-phosphate oxidase family protein [Lachnospiraceae bacterium]|nr:pyridoxamine 5'-phosphate oxidase family protein [Lachnospiraceae bacterium]MCH4063981.1 pyridoxamine 5'-phosphate oxidase family protein [Lachnospiraceae bacterium]MCH4103296.1 pyridoxamine 5'-phosphate oxidase family protein [Lachnospiraceae bacterium]